MAFSYKKCLLAVIAVMVAFVLVACNTTTFENSANVAEATALKQLLGQPGIVIVDARPEEDYSKGHVDGAVHLPPQLLSIGEPVAGIVAPLEKVVATLSDKGINTTDAVYIYDNQSGVSAGRVWWVLKAYGHEKVFVVNGGQDALLKAGLPLSADTPTRPATSYSAQALDTSMIATSEEVLAAVNAIEAGEGNTCILDVRTQAEYDEGYIPGAALYPHTNLFYKDGTFRSARDLALNFRDLGLKTDDQIIVYCKTSFRATPVALALEEAGYTNVKVYDGAWLEWQYKGLPVIAPEGAVQPSGGDGS